MASVYPSSSSMGLCSKCGNKCVDTWRASPCEHEICSKCLETAGHIDYCFGCRGNVASLACPGYGLGCSFDTTRGSWKDHVIKCLVFPLECPNRCGMIVGRKEMLTHLASDCLLRLTPCQFCQEGMFEVEVVDHEGSCPKAPVSCPYCLREGLKREEMEQHADNCSKTPKPCPLVEFGCRFSGVDKDVDQHLTVRNHIDCFRELKKSQQERQLEIDKLRSELDSCKNELAELSNGSGAMPFDKEILWVFRTPTTNFDPLLSPLYRHLETGAIVYFGLFCSRRGEMSHSNNIPDRGIVSATLRRYQMLTEKAVTIQGTSTVVLDGLEPDMIYPQHICDLSGLVRRGENGVRGGIRARVTTPRREVPRINGRAMCRDQLLDTTLTVGRQYVMHYKQESEQVQAPQPEPRPPPPRIPPY